MRILQEERTFPLLFEEGWTCLVRDETRTGWLFGDGVVNNGVFIVFFYVLKCRLFELKIYFNIYLNKSECVPVRTNSMVSSFGISSSKTFA